jgi:hypothetical protein
MTYEDNRDWPKYNERLVKRGEFYLDMNCVNNWYIELAEMNHKKHGSPFKYPKSFILFAAIIYSFMHMPYRQLEGYIGKLSTFIPGLKNADYTTLWRRITTMPIPIPPFSEKEDVVVAVDSTGFKVTNRGDWMREKHGKQRRGWLKVHIAVDVESKRLVSIEITDEKVVDEEMFRPLLKDVDIKDALGDGAYDNEDAFKFMEEKNVNIPGIKIRKNAKVGPEPAPRANAVLEFMKYGYDSWKMIHNYGDRWAVEGFFSAIKRIFGETVRATSVEGMVAELKRIFIFYDIILGL